MPLGTKSPLITTEHVQPMDVEQLDVVVQMASYTTRNHVVHN
jgi:hypothetical protein